MTRFARHPDGRKRKHEASSWQEMKSGNQSQQDAGNQAPNKTDQSNSATPDGPKRVFNVQDQEGGNNFENVQKPQGMMKNKGKKQMNSGGGQHSNDSQKKGLCFNCGQKGHKVSACPNPSDGFKDKINCRACKENGHKSFNCPNKELKAKYEAKIRKKYPQKNNNDNRRDFTSQSGDHRKQKPFPHQHKPGGFKRSIGDDESEELKMMWKKAKRSDQRRVKRQKIEEDTRACFKCRQPGHMVADCPEAQKDIEQGTGICFKCGSTEHGIAKCPVKLPKGKFPFAKCFICGESGHLSRQCPDNPRGLYPNGGCCDVCGAVDHLKKDCAEYQASVGVGGVRLGVLQQGGSIDSEDQLAAEIAAKKKAPKPAGNKPKIVKF